MKYFYAKKKGNVVFKNEGEKFSSNPHDFDEVFNDVTKEEYDNAIMYQVPLSDEQQLAVDKKKKLDELVEEALILDGTYAKVDGKLKIKKQV